MSLTDVLIFCSIKLFFYYFNFLINFGTTKVYIHVYIYLIVSHAASFVKAKKSMAGVDG